MERRVDSRRVGRKGEREEGCWSGIVEGLECVVSAGGSVGVGEPFAEGGARRRADIVYGGIWGVVERELLL